MIQAHVICCNDSVEYVFIGTEQHAQDKCNEMRDETYKTQYVTYSGNSDYEDYCCNHFWHIHSVDYEQEAL